jgi:hypothetical protein
MSICKWPSGWNDNKEYNVEIIAEVDRDDLCYEWETVAIVRRPVGADWEYALYDNCGCSCTYAFESNPDSCDLSWEPTVVNVYRQARAAVQDWPNHIDHKESLRKQIGENL